MNLFWALVFCAIVGAIAVSVSLRGSKKMWESEPKMTPEKIASAVRGTIIVAIVAYVVAAIALIGYFR